MTLDEALAHQAQGAVLLDIRPPEAFASGHVQGAVNVGLDGRYAEYAGDVIRPGQEVVLLSEPGRGTEAKVRLARIGFDAVLGEVPDIEAAMADRPEAATTAPRLPVSDVADWIADGDDLQVLDVRNPGEAALGAVPGATVIPLPRLLAHLDDLDRDRPVVVYCEAGYRSSVAASTLRANGYATVADMIGGYAAWAQGGHPVVAGAPVPA